MSADKTIGRVTDPERQQAEAYRYWQSLPIGDRLSAVWDASEAAYGFAAALHLRLRPARLGCQRPGRTTGP